MIIYLILMVCLSRNQQILEMNYNGKFRDLREMNMLKI